jgi:hypothetical protein
MKKVIVLLVALMTIPIIGFAQNLDQLGYISPFNDGLAAIKKGNQWAFINTEGTIVINFRNDLVPTEIGNNSYPVFNSDRCLITQKRDGISYFGYINENGKTIIKPQFLNATPFNDSKAIVLKLVKTELGKNEILDKRIVYYDYFEVVINDLEDVLHYISEPNHIALSREYIRRPPEITSKLISTNLVATLTTDRKWVIQKIN